MRDCYDCTRRIRAIYDNVAVRSNPGVIRVFLFDSDRLCIRNAEKVKISYSEINIFFFSISFYLIIFCSINPERYVIIRCITWNHLLSCYTWLRILSRVMCIERYAQVYTDNNVYLWSSHGVRCTWFKK